MQSTYVTWVGLQHARVHPAPCCCKSPWMAREGDYCHVVTPHDALLSILPGPIGRSVRDVLRLFMRPNNYSLHSTLEPSVARHTVQETKGRGPHDLPASYPLVNICFRSQLLAALVPVLKSAWWRHCRPHASRVLHVAVAARFRAPDSLFIHSSGHVKVTIALQYPIPTI